ncbi:MAG: hypothetical protein F6J93_20255 [Oscillatoria sp. SIO1A7]|nr:hypothetical protein [Oscillatoria sp. SIO1A7]
MWGVGCRNSSRYERNGRDRGLVFGAQRRGKPKAGTDWRDLAMLLLTFPELKTESGAVLERLIAANADELTISLWREIVAMDIEPEDEDDEF